MTVPSGPRIRTDNVYGTLSQAIDNDDTTISSAGLANLPAVSSAHAVIVIDPLRSAGAPEVVFVTAHTGSATSATVTRGGYGTTARSHDAGVLWVHAPTVDDVIRIVTSSTRPSDPYEGQLIYETDTDSYKGYNGSAWEHGLTLGAWQSWTPTLSNITVGNGTVTARYVKVGRHVTFRFKFKLGSTSVMGTDPRITLPVAPNAGYAAAEDIIGVCMSLDAGVAQYPGLLVWDSSNSAGFKVSNASGTYLTQPVVTATAPFTWATGDVLSAHGSYEAAA